VDSPHDHHADHGAPRRPSEAELRTVMEQSARDVEAGHTVVMAELDGIAAWHPARRA
jgi:hypothetical protein